MAALDDPNFDYDNDLEGGINVTVLDEQRESNVSRPPLTPIGLSVRDERRMFRTAEGSAMDQGGAAGERQRYEQFSPGPEYPAATSGSGNPMQYLGSYPGHYSGQYSGQYPEFWTHTSLVWTHQVSMYNF